MATGKDWRSGNADAFNGGDTLEVFDETNRRHNAAAAKDRRPRINLFVRVLTGVAFVYDASEVNQVLSKMDVKDSFKRRMARLIPQLSSDQQQALAGALSDEAVKNLRTLDPVVVALLQPLRECFRAESTADNADGKAYGGGHLRIFRGETGQNER
jgi:hypothetical protein